MTARSSAKKQTKRTTAAPSAKQAGFRARATEAPNARVLVFDPSDPNTIARIRAAAKQFDQRYGNDEAEAEELRQREGVYTKRGKLKKAFSA
jgi:hypothetical protein